MSLVTACRVPEDRAELAAEKGVWNNSDLGVWSGFTRSLYQILGEDSSAISSLSKGNMGVFFALACLIMDVNGLYANTSCCFTVLNQTLSSDVSLLKLMCKY